MKTEKCFVLDGAKSKEDLLEISFGKPDEEKVLLEQRHNIVSKICVLETVQYTWLSWIFTQYMIYSWITVVIPILQITIVKSTGQNIKFWLCQ